MAEQYMTEYYKEQLELKTTQQKLIESGVIRAAEYLISDMENKIERSGITLSDIQSLQDKLKESITALDKAKAETDELRQRYDKSRAEETAKE